MKMLNGHKYQLQKEKKVKYTREEVRSMVDDAPKFFQHRAALRNLNDEFQKARDVYCKSFKDWLDVVAPTDKRQGLHRMEYDTIFCFEVVRDFFVEVIVPELKSFAREWDIAIYYNHIEPDSIKVDTRPNYPAYPSGIVCLHWAGESGTTKLIAHQKVELEYWKLPT